MVENPELPHSRLTDRILRCFYDVNRELGHGFSEAVLCRALAIALDEAGMDVVAEARLEVSFRGRTVGKFDADLIVDRTILVEVKASAAIESYAVGQTINYLKVAGGGVGLLLNFGRKPEFKRLVVGDPLDRLPRPDRRPA